jgi:hypothetical protein
VLDKNTDDLIGFGAVDQHELCFVVGTGVAEEQHVLLRTCARVFLQTRQKVSRVLHHHG